MTHIFIYALESSICLALSYIAGRLVTGKDRHYSGTRAYWLLSIILAFVLPFLAQSVPVSTHEEGMVNAGVPAVSAMADSGESGDGGFSIDATSADMVVHIVMIAYLAGAALMMIMYALSYIRLMSYFRKCSSTESLGVGVLCVDENIQPFSWMDKIVMSRRDIGDRYVLRHELAHKELHHSADILLVDMMIILQWFNPFAYLVKKELFKVHEYQADAVVISSGADAFEYEMKILERASGKSLVMPGSHFSRVSVKDRIQMMLSEGRNVSVVWKLLCAGTVAAVSAAAFASPQVRTAENVMELMEGSRKADVTLHLDGNYYMDLEDHGKDSGLIEFAPPEAAVLVRNPDLEPGQTVPKFNGNADLMAFTRWVNGNIRYPDADRPSGKSGKVQISFVVGADGRVSDIRTEYATTPAMEEAIRSLIVKSSSMWEPGTDNGRPVPMKIDVPVMFRITK